MDQFIYKSDFNENLLNLFKQNLFETSWDSSKNIADPNESYHKFLEIFSTLYRNYFPLTKVTLKPKRKKALGLQMELQICPNESKNYMKIFSNVLQKIKKLTKLIKTFLK